MVQVAAVSQVSNSDLMRLLASRDTRWFKGVYFKLNVLIFFLLLTSMSNGYDSSMMNGLQTLSTWQGYFNNPHGSTLGIFNAIQNIGTLAGLPLAPYVADRFGRRLGVLLGCSVMLIGVAVQTAAQSTGMFIGCRCLIGFGLAFASLAAPLWVTELAFPTHRATLTSLYNTSWLLGSIVAAWTTYGTFRINNTWSWRIPSLLQGLPSVIQITVIWFIPESPRWLMDKGRTEAARAVLTKWHAGGDADDQLVDMELFEISEALRVEREASKESTYKSLFVGKGNIRRMLIIIPLAFFSQWSGNGIVSYYLTLVLDGVGITSTGNQTLINGILNIWNYGGALIASFVVDRVGRRPLFLASTVGMCITLSIWTGCYATYVKSAADVGASGVPLHPNNAAGHAVIAFIFLYYAFYVIALTPLIIAYPLEILPFRIRAKGMMILQLCISMASIFNQYINPIALDAIGWKYYIVYCIWVAVEAVYLYFTIVETKGKNGPLPLEEIAAIFDGEEQLERIAQHHQEVGQVDQLGAPANDASGDGKGGEAALLDHVEYKA